MSKGSKGCKMHTLEGKWDSSIMLHSSTDSTDIKKITLQPSPSHLPTLRGRALQNNFLYICSEYFKCLCAEAVIDKQKEKDVCLLQPIKYGSALLGPPPTLPSVSPQFSSRLIFKSS